jgi:hypothetical protein
MPSISRRFFLSAAAAASAAAGSVKSFVSHTVLRRPFAHVEDVAPRPYMLVDCVSLRIECSSLLRVKVEWDGCDEPLCEMSLRPRSQEQFMLLAVHGARAESPLRVTINSAKKFRVESLVVNFMHPPFRREDGMIVYHDAFYEPHVDNGFGLNVRPHHRKFYGPGKDISYGSL